MTRKQFAEENRRIKQLRKKYSENFIKSWLIGWRKVGANNAIFNEGQWR